MKGMICTKANLSNINLNDNDNTQNESSYKQKLMIIFGASILLGFTSFNFFSARKQRLQFYLTVHIDLYLDLAGDFTPSEPYKSI